MTADYLQKQGQGAGWGLWRVPSDRAVGSGRGSRTPDTRIMISLPMLGFPRDRGVPSMWHNVWQGLQIRTFGGRCEMSVPVAKRRPRDLHEFWRGCALSLR